MRECRSRSEMLPGPRMLRPGWGPKPVAPKLRKKLFDNPDRKITTQRDDAENIVAATENLRGRILQVSQATTVGFRIFKVAQSLGCRGFRQSISAKLLGRSYFRRRYSRTTSSKIETSSHLGLEKSGRLNDPRRASQAEYNASVVARG